MGLELSLAVSRHLSSKLGTGRVKCGQDKLLGLVLQMVTLGFRLLLQIGSVVQRCYRGVTEVLQRCYSVYITPYSSTET